MREGKPRRVENGWQIRVTDEHGKRRKRTFDTYAEASKALTAERARVADVKDGLRDPEPFDHTFDELADDHVRHRAPQKRSGHHDESIIRHARSQRFKKRYEHHHQWRNVSGWRARNGRTRSRMKMNLLEEGNSSP